MSDEETEIVETRISVRAVDADSVQDASKLQLEVEGQADVVMALAELCLSIISIGAGAVEARDGEGNVLPIFPWTFDPLAGDDPVAE